MNWRRQILPVLLAAAASAHAETTFMNFDWPANLSCRVEHRELEPNGTETVMAFALQAAPAPDGGTYITSSNAEMLGVEGRFTADEARAQARHYLASKLPPFHVGPAGTLKGLRDYQQARIELRAALMQTLPKQTSPAELDSMVDYLGTEDVLLNHISDFWNPAIEQWLGVQFGSKPNTTKAKVEVPPSTVPLDVDIVLAMSAAETCKRGGREHRCVELSYDETPAGDSLKQVMSAILGNAQGGGKEDVQALGMQTRVMALTEPDTLVPHLVTTTRTFQIGRPSTKDPMEMKQRQSWRFDCSEAGKR